MKFSAFIFSSLLMLLGGCASTSAINDHGGGRPECAADGSSSPISEEQALSIAKAAIAIRESWSQGERDADGNFRVVEYTLQRINHGGYRVEAHRAIAPANGGYAVWDSSNMRSVFLTINDKKIVTHYDHAGL